ncbi:HD-GYP domain-containing protein [Oceanidesulfovibrio marinus]|uniref:HD family phosphohydrolase n=1 Tax=Oceanidesulfovibrio marinus TaxID=370038 RepID=A0A6P1ZDN7_9BACT|nr:HD-GYP domain-containing protein [Oceanidesulfovibrio marinus]QJT09736.1 HD-GYP domain-containing protein [Oceanidesulfovibrio marinus]TVM31549.1 HD family phosphohydrolase [Oceanidesulfovibrio marinus]
MGYILTLNQQEPAGAQAPALKTGRTVSQRVITPPCSPLCRSIHQFAESLGNAMDAKDHCTKDHSEQVAVVAYGLALELGFSPKRAGAIHIAGHLHDIGKIGLPDSILSKPGKLDEHEWAEVRRHPVIGAQIVAPVAALNGASGIAGMILHHHERWDGRGYPDGLDGRDIPAGARVLAVADSLSAMVQDRPYRPGMSMADALEELWHASGTQLDPSMVAAFLDMADRAFRPAMPRNAAEAIALLSRLHGAPPDAPDSIYVPHL